MPATPGASTPPSPAEPAAPAQEDATLQRGLRNRHIQMIALGGAIGTGLFYGAGESVGAAGPGVLLAYLVGGAMIYLVMRALGEMSVHTPTSGAFSHHAAVNWGPFPAFVSGWNYWFNYVVVSMAELVVAGIYVEFWFPGVPRWVTSAVLLVLVTAVNLMGVRLYGETEFVFALVKVVAIVAFIAVGVLMIVTGVGNGGVPVGIDNLWAHGGFLPHGLGGVALGLVVVLFSFGGVELVGITAGEADDPARTLPKAIDQVLYRILLFYVGAIAVMLCLFPWNELGTSASPFVVVFDRLGLPAAAGVLNLVVLTAAVSAYNSGLYSNGRMLYSLARDGHAPAALGRVARNGAPVRAVLASSCATGLAVLLTYLVPEKIFLVLVSIATMAGIINWSMIVVTHLRFRARRTPAEQAQLAYRMPGYPVADYVVLVFLGAVVVGMAFLPQYRLAVGVGVVWLAVLSVAYVLHRRAHAQA